MLGVATRRLPCKSMNHKHIIVLCACPDEAVAGRIARAVVEESLAACVNRITGLRSTYSWGGAVQDEPEVLLIVKTTGARYEALELRIKALHPYELPEIIALPVLGGSSVYLDWVTHQTTA